MCDVEEIECIVFRTRKELKHCWVPVTGTRYQCINDVQSFWNSTHADMVTIYVPVVCKISLLTPWTCVRRYVGTSSIGNQNHGEFVCLNRNSKVPVGLLGVPWYQVRVPGTRYLVLRVTVTDGPDTWYRCLVLEPGTRYILHQRIYWSPEISVPVIIVQVWLVNKSLCNNSKQNKLYW